MQRGALENPKRIMNDFQQALAPLGLSADGPAVECSVPRLPGQQHAAPCKSLVHPHRHRRESNIYPGVYGECMQELPRNFLILSLVEFIIVSPLTRSGFSGVLFSLYSGQVLGGRQIFILWFFFVAPLLALILGLRYQLARQSRLVGYAINLLHAVYLLLALATFWSLAPVIKSDFWLGEWETELARNRWKDILVWKVSAVLVVLGAGAIIGLVPVFLKRRAP